MRFLTFGEIMMRLTPPDYGKICMADRFEANYGGSEANIALSLASLGERAAFFTVLPDNGLGKGALRMLRSDGVDCKTVIFAGEEDAPSLRLGTYYMETGFGIRSSNVIYDRKHSAFCEYDFGKVDVDALLDECDWLHLGGISPALSESCREFTLTLAKRAKELGKSVSFDGNFRAKLWSWEEARDYCTQILPYVDVLFGIEPYHLWVDEADHSKGDVKDGIPRQPDFTQQKQVFEAFAARYPNLSCIARHVRFAHSGSENSLKAYLWYEGKTYESKLLRFEILDRVGGGDAFASGLLYAMFQNYEPQEMVDFAVASSVMKHTIRGDANLVDSAQSIRNVMEMDFDIKR